MMKYLRKAIDSFTTKKQPKLSKRKSASLSICDTCRTDDVCNEKPFIKYCKCCGKVTSEAIMHSHTRRYTHKRRHHQHHHQHHSTINRRVGNIELKRNKFITYRVNDHQHEQVDEFSYRPVSSSVEEENLLKLRKFNGQSNMRVATTAMTTKTTTTAIVTKKFETLHHHHHHHHHKRHSKMSTGTSTDAATIARKRKLQKTLLTFIVEFASTPKKDQPKTSTPMKTI